MAILFRQVLPNTLSPLIVTGSLLVATAILIESALSFLGLGAPNLMSWGFMVGAGRSFLRDAWWLVTIPGIAILLTVLSINLVGEGHNDAPQPPALGPCERARPADRGPAGGAARVVGSPARGGRRLARHRPQRDPERGGRIRLGQVGHGQVHPGTASGAPRARRQRGHPLREPGPPPGRRGGDARHPGRTHLHDLPGADGGPEPADEGGRADRRDLPRAHRHQPAGPAAAGGGSCSPTFTSPTRSASPTAIRTSSPAGSARG